MDGRKVPAAALLFVLGAAACAPWGQWTIAGVAGGAADQALAPSLEPVERPALRAIFRDGRYVFRPVPPTLQRAAQREFETTSANADMKKVKLYSVFERSSETPQMLAFAMVWRGAVVEGALGWQAFLWGFSNNRGVDLDRGTIRGVDVAFGHQPGAKVVLIDYADDLTLMLTGPRRKSVEPLKDVARYLLRGR